jgi:glycine C-acetyltransferase
MDEHPPMPLEEKIDMITSGRMPMSVGVRAFTNPDIYSRADGYLQADKVFDRSYIHWPNKMTTSPPGPTTTGYDFLNHKQFSGINFATQDYMSMCHHPGAVAAGVEALKRYGSHSGGSPLFFGKHPYYLQVLDSLKRAFSKIMPTPSPSIFSAGWMAGFGVVAALSSKNDHIILDELCHNCLQLGARGSLAKIHKIEHLNDDLMIAKLEELRQKHPTAGILVITEGLFSMDSDCADLDRLQKATKQHQALLIVDCAHDMFGVGEKGLGNPGERIKDFSNVVLLGSGSKALSNNFGWCVSNYPALPSFMGYFAGSLTFSNALAPSVAAIVSHNIDLLMSPEGDDRRRRNKENAIYIRKRLTDAGFEVIGEPCPVVIVLIGSELMSRAIANMMYDEGIIVNSVEFPACAPGDSRLRLQVQSDHTKEHLDTFVDKLVEIMPKVEEYLEKDKFTNTVQQALARAISGESTQPQQKL